MIKVESVPVLPKLKDAVHAWLREESKKTAERVILAKVAKLEVEYINRVLKGNTEEAAMTMAEIHKHQSCVDVLNELLNETEMTEAKLTP